MWNADFPEEHTDQSDDTFTTRVHSQATSMRLDTEKQYHDAKKDAFEKYNALLVQQEDDKLIAKLYCCLHQSITPQGDGQDNVLMSESAYIQQQELIDNFKARIMPLGIQAKGVIEKHAIESKKITVVAEGLKNKMQEVIAIQDSSLHELDEVQKYILNNRKGCLEKIPEIANEYHREVATIQEDFNKKMAEYWAKIEEFPRCEHMSRFENAVRKTVMDV